MSIQWFPGHMNKAKKAIAGRIKTIDVVIEMLDARLPGSSSNPMLAALTRGKSALKILNKQDLADPQRTAQWIAYYNDRPNTKALALDASDRAPAQKLIRMCRSLVPNRGGIDKPLRVMICGIPNVGKSTLINTLNGRKIAKTGNEPGVTKGEQRIFLADDFWLFDTPGMLWPKIIVEEGGYNLAASGAIGRNALDEEEVALELLNYLQGNYPQTLCDRYKLDDDIREMSDDELMHAIARRRGALLSGGRVHIQKVAELILTDFRAGAIGRISLETPEQWLQWEKAGKLKEAALREERAKRMAERKGNSD